MLKIIKFNHTLNYLFEAKKDKSCALCMSGCTQCTFYSVETWQDNCWTTFNFWISWIKHVGHSVYFNTAVTSPEILGKLRFWTKKRARSISYNHIKMMQSMVYLISLFTLILIKWHVTSPEILEEWMNKY